MCFLFIKCLLSDILLKGDSSRGYLYKRTPWGNFYGQKTPIIYSIETKIPVRPPNHERNRFLKLDPQEQQKAS